MDNLTINEIKIKSYRVYYSDGNQREFGADNIFNLIIFLEDEAPDEIDKITKIEEC